MVKRVEQFNRYLDETSNMKIKIRGIRYPDDNEYGEPQEPEPVEADLEYTHRWTPRYDNRVLCKLYNLQYYYIAHPEKMPKYTVMVTLTGSHATPRNLKKGGLQHLPYMEKFLEAHRKEKKMVGKYLGTVDYLSILESHPESGYVHAHDLYFLDEKPSDEILAIITNHWINTQKMGSRQHGIKIEIKEPKDFHDIQSLIAYPLSYLGGSQISTISHWTKYDVIFNTCLWLSGKPKLYGGIGKRARAFQPSRSLSAIMNQGTHDSNYYHLDTTLKKENEESELYRAPDYDEDIKTYMMFGGDNEQWSTLKSLKEMKRMENRILCV